MNSKPVQILRGGGVPSLEKETLKQEEWSTDIFKELV